MWRLGLERCGGWFYTDRCKRDFENLWFNGASWDLDDRRYATVFTISFHAKVTIISCITFFLMSPASFFGLSFA